MKWWKKKWKPDPSLNALVSSLFVKLDNKQGKQLQQSLDWLQFYSYFK